MNSRPDNFAFDETASFVGRREELERLQQLVDSSAGLVSVVGPPGCGKSRFLRRFVSQWRESTDGQFALISPKAKGAEGLKEAFERVLKSGKAPSLVVVDAFQVDSERNSMVEMEDRLRAFIEDCVEATVLVACEEVVSMAGAHIFSLGGLTVDDGVELFRQRLKMMRAAEGVVGQDRAVVEELVRKLDGLPLAIEYAAARSIALGPEELLELIRESPLWLYRDENGGHPAVLPGLHRTALEELSDKNRAILEGGSLFSETFDVRSLSKLMESEVVQNGQKIQKADVVDAIQVLLRGSLIYDERSESSQRRGGLLSRRFRVYETVRALLWKEHSQERRQALRDLFVDYCQELGWRLRDQRYRAGGFEKVAELRRAKEEIFTACTWAEEQGGDRFVSLVLSRIAILRDQGESGRWMEQVEEVGALEIEDKSLQAEWAILQAEVAEERDDSEEALRWWNQALTISDELEQPELKGRIYLEISEVHRRSGDLVAAGDAIEAAHSGGGRYVRRAAHAYGAANCAERGQEKEAREHLDELQRRRPGSDLRLECRLWQRAGYGCHYLKNFDEQRRCYVKAHGFAEEVDDPALRALCTQSLGDNAYVRGDLREARRRYEEALPLLQQQGAQHRHAVLMGNLATIIHRCGDLQGAYPVYMDGLGLHRQNQSRAYEGVVLFGIAALHHEREQYDDAVHRYEQALEVYEELEMDFDRGATHIALGWLAMERRQSKAGQKNLRAALTVLGGVANASEWALLAHVSLHLMDACGQLATPLGEETPSVDLSARRRDQISEVEWLAVRIAERIETMRDAGEGADADVEEGDVEDGDREQRFPSLYGRLVDHLLRPGALRASAANLLDGTGADGPRARVDESDLAVGPDTRWFRVGAEDLVDIRRRGAIRLILDGFVEKYLESPGESWTVEDLFELGWPGEDIRPKSAADRVYWAIRTLRDLGLRELLVTTDEGYCLDPDAAIRRCEDLELI